jgi:ribA/ribD-fused uncharacterized protein
LIDSFRGDYHFLSNFEKLTNPIRWSNVLYWTSEHFFAAMKTLSYDDRVWIAGLSEPGMAKRAASPRGYNNHKITLRRDWDDVRILVMRMALIMKFTNNPILLYKLCATGNKMLVEGNTWHDNTWGNCTCQKCSRIVGMNWLGLLLMELRNNFITIG